MSGIIINYQYGMLTNNEKGTLLKLFIRSGYVLDFTTPDFDAFTADSVGLAICEKYQMSKGKTLIAFIKEANDEDSTKLLSDLFTYYETQYSAFEYETNDPDIMGLSSGAYRQLYLNCKNIIERYRRAEPNREIAKAVKDSFSSEYMNQQIKLMLENQESYPAESIGKAKELVESCCRTILSQRGIAIDEKWSFQQMVSRVFDELEVKPDKVDEQDPIASSLKKLYGSLKGIIQPIAEIRNEFGTGHGKAMNFIGLDSRHSKLLVGMCLTLVQFMWSTHEEKPFVMS